MSKKFERPSSNASDNRSRFSTDKKRSTKKANSSSFNRFKGDSPSPEFKSEGTRKNADTNFSEEKKERSFNKPKGDFKKDYETKRGERTEVKSEGGERENKKAFKTKKPEFDKKTNNTSFNRFRNDARPSDFKEGDTKSTKTNFSEKKYVPKKNKPFSKSYSSDKKPTTTKVVKPGEEGMMRLNKYLSNAGICSRREADELIASGVVKVNGKIITEMGFKIKPTDIVNYGGQTLKKERLVYLILNKPKDYITTFDDPQARKTVFELIKDACQERIYPVGRLDRNTTGLLLFTNDGELTKKLTHPRYGVRKVYHVELDKPLKKADLEEITEGIELEDGEIKVDDIAYVGNGADKTQVGVEIHSGRNRIVRRIFEHFEYKVKKLDRVVFGPLTKKDMPRGRWRILTEAEVGMLKMISSKD